VVVAEEGPSREAAPATKKRKIGTAVGGLGVSDRFAVELMETCVALGGRMSSPEVRESSARMLKVTGGRWPRNVLIPRAAGEDMFTSRMARELKIFPYGRNIATVVSAVMDKDRQVAARKRRAITRFEDPVREVKRARGGAKSAAPGGVKPPPAAKPTVPGPSKSSAGLRVAASGVGKPPSTEPAKERRLPSPVRTDKAAAGGADFDTDICVDDYLVGESFFRLGLEQDYGAGSNAGQLAIVPSTVMATSPATTVGAKGISRDPWSKFCASGEISSVAAARDVAGIVSQQLKHVSHLRLRWFVFLTWLRI
jgi:hypothetical protein